MAAAACDSNGTGGGGTLPADAAPSWPRAAKITLEPREPAGYAFAVPIPPPSRRFRATFPVIPAGRPARARRDLERVRDLARGVGGRRHGDGARMRRPDRMAERPAGRQRWRDLPLA